MSLRNRLQAMRAAAGEVPLPVLAVRLAAWKLWRLTRARPVVRLHARSRMRIQAAPHEHGIRAGIFLLRDAYEPSVRHAIGRFVAEGSTCYDIGANLGLWTLLMAERVGPSGRVAAFEPVPDTARALGDSLHLSGHVNVEVQVVALSDREGAATIYIPDDVGRGALAPESAGDTAVAVTLRRLDDVWIAAGRPAVGFVKLDVEGAEPLVLAGAPAMLAATRPVVCCEVNPAKLANLGFAPAAILDVFADLGYDALAWDAARGALRPRGQGAADDAVADLVFMPRDPSADPASTRQAVNAPA